jgi:hypothetical protein
MSDYAHVRNRVKAGRTRIEQMSSAVYLTNDIAASLLPDALPSSAHRCARAERRSTFAVVQLPEAARSGLDGSEPRRNPY